MKKILLTFMAVVILGSPRFVLAAAKKYTHVNRSLEYAVQVDTSWEVHKGKSSDLFGLPKLNSKIQVSVSRNDSGPNVPTFKAEREYLNHGWHAYVNQYQKDLKKLLEGTDFNVTFSDLKYFTVNGYRAVSYTQTTTLGSNKGVAYVYLVSSGPHVIFEFDAIGDSKYLPSVEKLVKSIRIDAASSTIFTNKTEGYSMKYPAWWFQMKQADVDLVTNSTSPYRFFSEYSNNNILEDTVYDVQVKRVDRSVYWTKAQRTALNQGWDQFMTEYLKVYDSRNVIDTSAGYTQDTPTNIVERTAPIRYGLNGYTASIFFTKEKVKEPSLIPLGTPIRRVVVVVTKNMKDVYMIVGSYRGADKNTVIPTPFTPDFRTLAQSFRIL